MGVSLFSANSFISKVNNISNISNHTTSSNNEIVTETLDFDLFDESNSLSNLEVSQEKIDYFTELLSDEEKYNNKISGMSEEEYKEFVTFIKGKYSERIDKVSEQIDLTKAELKDLNNLLKCDEDTLLLLIDQEEKIKKSIDTKIVLAKTDLKTNSLEEYGINEVDIKCNSVEELKEKVLNSSEYKNKITEMHAAGDRILKNTLKVYKQYSKYDGLTYNDILLLREYYNNTLVQLESTKQGLENANKTVLYDHLELLKGYSDFIASKHITADDLKDYISSKKDQFDINFITIDYDKYLRDYPGTSPLEFARAIKEYKDQLSSEGVKVDSIQVKGIDNYNDFIKLIEIEEYQKNLKDGKEYLIPLASENINYAKIYDFLYQQDPEKASQYMEDISSVLKQYEGACMATSEIKELGEFDYRNPPQFLMDYLNVTADGVGDGIYDFGEGFVKILADGELSSQDYKAMFYMSYLEQNDKRFGGILSLNKFYEGGQAVGMMLPVVTASTIFAGVAPELAAVSIAGSNVGQITSLGLMGLSTYGTVQNQLKFEGYSDADAYKYALLAAGSEALFEKYGGLIGLADVPGANFIHRMLKEGGQEAAQEVFQQVLGDHYILGKDIDLGELTKDTFNSFVMGVIVAGSLNGYTNSLSFSLGGVSYNLSGKDQKSLAKLLNSLNESNNLDLDDLKYLFKYCKNNNIDIASASNNLIEIFDQIEDVSSLDMIDYLKIIEYTQKNNTDVLTAMEELNYIDYLNIILDLDYSSMSTEEIINVFSDKNVIKQINNSSPEEFAKILNEVIDANLDCLSLDCFTDKILSFDAEDLGDFINKVNVLDEYLNVETQVNPDNIYKMYDYFINVVSDYNNYMYWQKLMDLESTFVSEKSYLIGEKLQEKYKKLDLSIGKMLNTISRKIQNSDGDFDFINGIFRPRNYSAHKYYDLSYEIDGRKYTLTNEDGFFDLSPFNPEFFEAALNDNLKISVSENVKMSNLIIKMPSGINYITYEENGEEKQLIIDNPFFSFVDLNERIDSNNNVVIKNITPIGDNINVRLPFEDIGKPFMLEYTMDGREYEKILFPTDLADDICGLDIKNFIIYNNLFGANNFKISEIPSDVQFEDSDYDYVKALPNSNELFSDNKFGGDQSDPALILYDYFEGVIDNYINEMKAVLFVDIVRKYYPRATEKQVYDLAYAYYEHGCEYMAAANAYCTYCNSIEGGEQLFKDKTGFDLKFYDGSDSSINVEALAFDIFLDKHIRKFGYDINRTITDSYGVGWSNQSIQNDIIQYFLNRKIDVDYYYTRGVINERFSLEKSNIIRSYISQYKNSFMIIGSKGFDLQFSGDPRLIDYSDKALKSAEFDRYNHIEKNVGSHGMLITGITDDGQIEVSTWGEKAIYLYDNASLLALCHLTFK